MRVCDYHHVMAALWCLVSYDNSLSSDKVREKGIEGWTGQMVIEPQLLRVGKPSPVDTLDSYQGEACQKFAGN